ncbi:hypothetical protein P5V15_012511 [Pogonomyrmex californicus]
MQPQCQTMDALADIIKAKEDVSIDLCSMKNLELEVLRYLYRNVKDEKCHEIGHTYMRLLSPFHPDKNDIRAADWLFVLNTLNSGSFWLPNNETWTVHGLTGYMALCAAIKRAIDKGVPMWNPKFYTALSERAMAEIFRGDKGTTIPHLVEKMTILHDIGTILLDKYKGTFINCIRSCQRNPLQLVITLFNDFEPYHEKETYNEKDVFLYTKAWIMVNDVWAFFKNHQLSLDMKIQKIPTIYVDYRVSRIFIYFKVLRYSKRLIDKIKETDENFSLDTLRGSKEELEIRSSSIFLANLLNKRLQTRHGKFDKEKGQYCDSTFDYSCIIDNFFWDYQQVNDAQLKKVELCDVSTGHYYYK